MQAVLKIISHEDRKDITHWLAKGDCESTQKKAEKI